MHGKWQAFSALSSAVMLRFSWSVVMLHVLETFLFHDTKLQRKIIVVWSKVAFFAAVVERDDGILFYS